MSERSSELLAVATWNAENAFGDPGRVAGAFDFLDSLGWRPQVLFLGELAAAGVFDGERPSADVSQLREAFAERGYGRMVITGYSDAPGERNASVMAMCVHDAVDATAMPRVERYGRRFGIALRLGAQALELRGVHPSDTDEARRLGTLRDVLGSVAVSHAALDDSGPDAGDTVIFGDFNALSDDDAHPQPRLFRRLQRLGLGGINFDFYDTPLLRIPGFAVRIIRMAEGRARALLTDHGLHNANTEYDPTCHHRPFHAALDDLYASSGVEFIDFQIRQPIVDGVRLSDHDLLLATIRTRTER